MCVCGGGGGTNIPLPHKKPLVIGWGWGWRYFTKHLTSNDTHIIQTSLVFPTDLSVKNLTFHWLPSSIYSHRFCFIPYSVQIKWMRNGAEIEESQFQNIKIRNNILVVSSATRRDMADFSCAASNIAGSRTSAAARLTVSGECSRQQTTP